MSDKGLGRVLAAGFIGVLLGAVAIWLVADGARLAFFPSEPMDTEAESARRSVTLEALAESLEGDIRARLELEEQLAELRAEVEQLRSPLAPDVAQGQSEHGSYDDPPIDSIALSDRSRPGSPSGDAGEDSLGAREEALFDEAALTRLGLYPRDAELLHERWEQHQLERLYLADTAAREGWLQTPRFRSETQAAQTALREELGDESFDLLLYASGQPNRVVVRGLLERSPAGDAGFEAGDVIVSYGDRRIFRPGELKQMTASGSAGESVWVEIIRKGRPASLRVPRGPLGIFTRAGRIEPTLR